MPAQDEPVLADEDRYLWEEVWTPALLAHAKTHAFRRHVEQAKIQARAALDKSTSACVMVSGGKDSTALGELISGEMGLRLSYASEKDDLDYPGEEEHLAALAARWGVEIDILRPAFSLEQWLRENGQGMSASDNLHARLSAFSDESFYRLVDAHNEGYDVIFLGLRKEESKARMRNRVGNGLLYQGRVGACLGKWTCNPLGDWSGKDVLAYCLSRGAPLLPLYRCVAFMHRDEPWRIRKSWWIPGASSRYGGAAWLKRYYPSLFRKLCEIFPDAHSMA